MRVRTRKAADGVAFGSGLRPPLIDGCVWVKLAVLPASIVGSSRRDTATTPRICVRLRTWTTSSNVSVSTHAVYLTTSRRCLCHDGARLPHRRHPESQTHAGCLSSVPGNLAATHNVEISVCMQLARPPDHICRSQSRIKCDSGPVNNQCGRMAPLPPFSSSLSARAPGDPVRNDLLLRGAAISCCRNCLSQLRKIGKLHRLAIGFRFLKGMFRLLDLALGIDSTRTTSVVLACCAQRHLDSLCRAFRSSSFEPMRLTMLCETRLRCQQAL